MNIMTRLQQHYEYVCENVPKDTILFISVIGSQNYGLATENSDVDTYCIVMPDIGKLCLNSKPFDSTTYYLDGEHITMKTIQDWYHELIGGSPNALECLYTDYVICNEKYKWFYNALKAERDKISRINPFKIKHASKGIALNIFRREEMQGKMVSTILRAKRILDLYDTQPYEVCINAGSDEKILKAKIDGVYNSGEVMEIINEIKNMEIPFSEIDYSTINMIEENVCKVVKEYLRNELNEKI